MTVARVWAYAAAETDEGHFRKRQTKSSNIRANCLLSLPTTTRLAVWFGGLWICSEGGESRELQRAKGFCLLLIVKRCRQHDLGQGLACGPFHP